MPFNLYDSGEGKSKKNNITSIAPGVVQGNCDLIMQGKVLVRIPSIGMEVWARQAAAGAGSNRGMASFPKKDDEVVVVFNQEDPNDAYLIGGLWSTSKQPPTSLPTDVQNKMIIRTEAGHIIEFDDILQSITITSSTGQKIKMSPLDGILIDNIKNSISLGVDGSVNLKGVPGNSISIDISGAISITSVSKISLNAPIIDITGATSVSVTSANVRINS